MCCLLDIYDVMRDYCTYFLTDATKLILITNTDLAQRYVFVSSTAAVRLSSTAASRTSRARLPYLSRLAAVRLV